MVSESEIAFISATAAAFLVIASSSILMEKIKKNENQTLVDGVIKPKQRSARLVRKKKIPKIKVQWQSEQEGREHKSLIYQEKGAAIRPALQAPPPAVEDPLRGLLTPQEVERILLGDRPQPAAPEVAATFADAPRPPS